MKLIRTHYLSIYLQDLKDYPIVPALPSYGRGRELPGPRYSSLINGDGLEDVIITGEPVRFNQFATSAFF